MKYCHGENVFDTRLASMYMWVAFCVLVAGSLDEFGSPAHLMCQVSVIVPEAGTL